MKSAQQFADLSPTLHPGQTNGAEATAWETDEQSNAGHIVLARLVREAFRAEPGLRGKHICIEAFTGVVQLSGFVRSRSDMERALELASGVSGVTSIRNCIQLA